MAVPIDLRDDFDGLGLRTLANATKNAAQARRLLALAKVYDGSSRTDAARIGGVGLRERARLGLALQCHGPDGLIDGKAPGQPPKLNEEQRQAVAKLVESNPIPAIHGIVRWRRKDLAHWIFEVYRILLDETTGGRELKALGFAKLSTRPRHDGQNEFEGDALKKTFPPNWQRSRPVCRPTPR